MACPELLAHETAVNHWKQLLLPRLLKVSHNPFILLTSQTSRLISEKEAQFFLRPTKSVPTTTRHLKKIRLPLSSSRKPRYSSAKVGHPQTFSKVDTPVYTYTQGSSNVVWMFPKIKISALENDTSRSNLQLIQVRIFSLTNFF